MRKQKLAGGRGGAMQIKPEVNADGRGGALVCKLTHDDMQIRGEKAN